MFTVWDLYFAQVVGMNLHPGTTRDNAREMTLEECADLVDKMLEVRKCRLELVQQ
jgi:hypothetical protein